jgi:hypothetical protein
MIDGLPTTLHRVQASKGLPDRGGHGGGDPRRLRQGGRPVRQANGIVFKKTFVNLDQPELCARQMHEDWGETTGRPAEESRRAVEQG